ncbi:MAG: ATP-binding protein [Pseudomonadota bacterium]|nr:ATP-binding protein [Pseudomonadota bacterium]
MTNSVNPLRAFHNIVANQAISFDAKVEQLLGFGLELFGLDIGIVSKVVNQTYFIQFVVSPIPELTPGMTFTLEETYCTHTLKAQHATGFHYAGKSEIASHPCYQAQGLEAYLGAPILLNDEVYGTVNFSSPNPVSPFPPEAYDYVELIAQWLGAEIARNEAMARLTAQAATLDKLEKVGKIGTWSVDLLTGYIEWGKQTKLIHGVEDDYVPSIESALAFYPEGEQREKIQQVMSHAIENGRPWNIRAQLITAQGKARWVVSRGEVELQDGQCVKLYGTFQDVTLNVERARELQLAKDKAEQASKVKSVFLANMSHEIRTPMNSILGTLQLLSQASLEPTLQNLVSKAGYSAKTLLTIVNDVLDYSKIEANQLTLENAPFSALEISESVISDLLPEAEARQISLTLESADNFIDGWAGDAVRIRQILLNLVSNAVKFTHKGGVRVELLSSPQTENPWLQLNVSDTGIGMSEDVQQLIFERFAQADSSTTRKYGGTGLGMSITISLVNLMEGDLTVNSQPGLGTHISVRLPLKPASLTTEPASQQAAEPPQLRGRRILVAEDNDINQLVLASMLESTAADVTFVANGREAVAAVGSGCFDLVLMDIQMPEMDGIEAFKLINEQHKHLPIVALTANVSPRDVSAYLNTGFTSHIGKPIDMQLLYSCLSRLLA